MTIMDKNEVNISQLKDDERQQCEIWTRVMGYHRPLSYFNIGKKGEHAERVHFLESITHKSCNCSDC
jgi:anaerobic ribonucleoside-triphosphate reductase